MRQRLLKQIPQIQPMIDINLTKQEKVKKQLGSIQEKITNKLENNQIEISKTQIPFINQKQRQVSEDAAYQRLLQEKKRMEEKIKSLQNTQKLYMNKSRVTQRSRVSPGYEKTQLTQQDKINLKKLKKKMRDFQKSIQKKNQQIQQQVLRMRKQDEQRIVRERNAANELKKLKIQQKLQQIKLKNLQRQNKKKEQDTLIKRIYQKKKLYELLDQSWKQKNNQQQQRKYQLMEARLKEKHMDFVDLKEHQKKYNSIMQQKKRQLQDRRLNSSRQGHNGSFCGSRSKYYTMMLKQQQKVKQQQQKKKQQAKLIHMRRLQYAQHVYQQFAPKKPLSENEVTNQKQKSQQQPKIVRLTKEQIKQIGNRYLEKGNRRAKKKQNKDESQTIDVNDKQKSNEGSKKATSTISHYHDYLRDARLKKVQHDYYSGFYNSPKSQAQKIMKSEKIDKQDKIAKIKLLASRFDTSSTDIISKIQGKIQILQVIN